MRALILGAGGQDGRLLSEELLNRGYTTVGLVRPGLEKHRDYPAYGQTVPMDVTDYRKLLEFMEAWKPSIIYHLAAIHGASGFEYETVWPTAVKVNTLSLHTVLEFARTAPGTRVVYASSVKVFGLLTGEISEDSPQIGNCLYSISKIASHQLIYYYRRKYAVTASILFLSNHESIYRAPEFFVPKLSELVIKKTPLIEALTHFKELNFWCDWGCAREFMFAAAAVGENACGDDFCIATGNATNGADLVYSTFQRYGLDRSSRLCHSTPPPFTINTQKLNRFVDYTPTRSIADVIDELILSQR